MTAPVRPGSRRLMREINEALVLRTVRERGPISRTDIAQHARLSPATVSDISNLLIEQNLVYERSEGPSTGGRRPVLLDVNDDAGLVVGVKVTQSHLVVALTNLGATLVEQETVALGHDPAPEPVVAALADAVRRMQERHPGRRVFGIGLGLAGTIDRDAGVCTFSPLLHWRNVPVRALVQARLELPVVVENDVNTLTLAEQWFGNGLGVQDFVVVTVGRGVGMGMVLGGRLYRGGLGGGGEIGHLTMEPGGPRCECGKYGCLEALVAEPALSAAIEERLGRALPLAEAAALAERGDQRAQEVFTRAGRTLGTAIAHVVNVLNPPLIILGGEGLGFLPPMSAALRETLSTESFPGFSERLQLVVEPWGDDAWARGAAGLMLEEAFSPTLYSHHQAAGGLSSR